MSLPRTPLRFGAGDLNGVLGLVVDNLSILAFLSTALIGGFGVPASIVYGRMFPGTALGVLLGNLAYTVMARRLARREGRDDVTAMPLGLDAPTSIGLALLVLGPAFTGFRQGGMDTQAAGIATWQLGMGALVVMGVLKLVLSFVGGTVRRYVPRAGLLGSIAGIALVLMGFLPLVEIMKLPVVGLPALGVVLYALIARGRMPWRLPGVLVAVLVAWALYEGFGALGWLGAGWHAPSAWHGQAAWPWPTLGWLHGVTLTVPYLALILPFGLLMVVGGINVTESARAAGDTFRTRDVLLVEALATLAAGVCGGVAQTTPYIGQPAYKAMGARTGYTLGAGLLIGIGGMLGVLSGLVDALPLAVLAPILIYVAIGITTQAFEATERRHASAVVLAFFPAIARMLTIKLTDPAYLAPARATALLADRGHGLTELAVIAALGNGFIITSMLWASVLVALIDQRPGHAALIALLGAAFTACGLIHSALPSGGIFLPWHLHGAPAELMHAFAGAYVALAAVLLALTLAGRRGDARATGA